MRVIYLLINFQNKCLVYDPYDFQVNQRPI